ncbi:hypothetical protein PF010_g12336 [Phytophthora fragariae]|uniref:Uncharacterized protein n=1 Tax=Phytophthora fragariae TaxID=53985 RepID=A0A6A3KEH7_9STRA|nr:hypothetical protein PF011_g12656 [Phytophthora fragariae]KAE9107248.1 hypothetical protein PF010_g12336 [Phytophthora fragariae]KAE9229143.1 hypothetical protein PF004_g10862 [Phytophthora fragariae]
MATSCAPTACLARTAAAVRLSDESSDVLVALLVVRRCGRRPHSPSLASAGWSSDTIAVKCRMAAAIADISGVIVAGVSIVRSPIGGLSLVSAFPVVRGVVDDATRAALDGASRVGTRC